MQLIFKQAMCKFHNQKTNLKWFFDCRPCNWPWS